MSRFSEKYGNLVYWSVVGILFLLVSARAFFIPFSHDESATFFYYIQSGEFLPFRSHLYTNNHFLNSALSSLCYWIAGSHRFVLRLPNVLSFLLVAWALYRLFKHCRHWSSRLLLCGFFLFTYNFLDFFELCRGYGLSMALLIMGLVLVLDYFSKPTFPRLTGAVLCLQLALAANLSLIPLVTLLWVLLLYFQYRHKRLAARGTVLLNVTSLILILFWLNYLLLLKASGKLDSGDSVNYWQITFVSLIEMIFGSKALWLQVSLVLAYTFSLVLSIKTFFKGQQNSMRIFQKRVFFTLLFTAMVLGIFLQRLLLGVNYPEDRTGLYLYVLYALMLVFTFEALPEIYSSIFSPAFVSLSMGLFAGAYNLQSFTHYFYHVLPKSFYEYLIQEARNSPEPFTVGGRFSREMNYAFMNYRGGARLNPMDTPPQMRMNCDYNLAQDWERPYYKTYYDEVLRDKYWGHVLLKRKKSLSRYLLTEQDSIPRYYNHSSEFVEFLRSGDPLFKNKGPLEIDLSIYFKKVPAPFNAFLVVSVETSSQPKLYYSRIALNWLDDDLSGESRRLKLCTGSIPDDFTSLVVYLWNIDQKNYDFSLQSLKISELKGEGVGVEIPEEYYTKLYKLNHKPQL